MHLFISWHLQCVFNARNALEAQEELNLFLPKETPILPTAFLIFSFYLGSDLLLSALPGSFGNSPWIILASSSIWVVRATIFFMITGSLLDTVTASLPYHPSSLTSLS